METVTGLRERVAALLRAAAEAVSARSRLATAALDAVLVNLAALAALWLRFEGQIPPLYLDVWLTFAPAVTAIRLACFWAFGLYHRVWKYASISEAVAIGKSTTAGTAVLVALWLFPRDRLFYPRSAILLEWLLVIVLIAGSRFTWRLLREVLYGSPSRHQSSDHVLIVGAGDAGETVVRELRRRPGAGHPVGFVDDDPGKYGTSIHGVRVLGGRDRLPHMAQQVDRIIIAIPSASSATIRQIVELCKDGRAKLLIMPGMLTTADPMVQGVVRPIQVEDLLGRVEVKLDVDEIAAYLRGQRVLVTGAGGWIGSELCRQIVRLEPERIILVGHAESDIYEINLELRRLWRPSAIRTVIADVRGREKVERIIGGEQPHVIFHAAAHKHVPLMEENPDEAVLNNIGGTLNLAEAASRWGVGRFIFISTDKAVNPTSVMGVSKRIAEMCLQDLFNPGPTKFVIVRFGNVMDSTGSVIPLFKQQIARGGPVTVTHPEMMRYFMTVTEAVKLVIQAGTMGQGGEIFLLDMGEPLKIIDLARTMIRLAGLRPGEDIEIRIIGTRPGEKLREEILSAEEGVITTRHEKIYVCRPAPTLPAPALRAAVAQLLEAAHSGDVEEIRPMMAAIATTYNPHHARSES